MTLKGINNKNNLFLIYNNLNSRIYQYKIICKLQYHNIICICCHIKAFFAQGSVVIIFNVCHYVLVLLTQTWSRKVYHRSTWKIVQTLDYFQARNQIPAGTICIDQYLSIRPYRSVLAGIYFFIVFLCGSVYRLTHHYCTSMADYGNQHQFNI